MRFPAGTLSSMKAQPINAVRERIRQVKAELARLRMVEKFSLLESRSRAKGKAVPSERR